MMNYDTKNKRDTIEFNGKVFIKTLIKFNDETEKNIFSNYKSKTLGETAKKDKYKHLKNVVNDLNRDMPFGQYLYDAKERGDKTYLESLNPYGDKSFCKFEILDESIFHKRGLYVYRIKHEIKYIGRCLDNYKLRINSGYGKITPVNCLKHGRSTNCRINYFITNYYKDIELYVHPMKNSNDIKRLEKELIAKEKPEWNRQLYK